MDSLFMDTILWPITPKNRCEVNDELRNLDIIDNEFFMCLMSIEKHI